VPVKAVSEQLGHGSIALTIETYQHVMPGMQADAARLYEALAKPARTDPVDRRRNTA
jgi:integrase